MRNNRPFAAFVLVGFFAAGLASAASREEKREAAGKEKDREVATGWSWKVGEDDDKDLHLRLFLNGKKAFTFKIGAGGAISAMNETLGEKPLPLLSPSNEGERTDRIIQWTAWCDDIVSDVPSLSKPSRRFNITQGGTQNGTVTEIGDVIVAGGGRRVDVYAVPKDQWKPEQQKEIRCTLSALTRYEPLPDGILKITRFIRIGEVTLHEKPMGFDRLYVEAWTPFIRGQGGFDAVALQLDAKGQPSQAYEVGKQFPHYPNLEAQTTSGYAIVFNTRRPAERTAVGVVFGNKPAAPPETGNVSLFNLMEWNDGIGVLPGVIFRNVGTGSIVEQTIYLVPRPGLTEQMRGTLEALVGGAAPPRLWKPAQFSNTDLNEIATRLTANTNRPGTRTDHLQPLVRRE